MTITQIKGFVKYIDLQLKKTFEKLDKKKTENT